MPTLLNYASPKTARSAGMSLACANGTSCPVSLARSNCPAGYYPAASAMTEVNRTTPSAAYRWMVGNATP